MERWVKGFPDYTVRRDGAIFSHKRGKRQLKPRRHNQGYSAVALCHHGAIRYFLVHRLVAEHFLAPLNAKHEVNHKDGDKKNNHVRNLEWTNRSGNTEHSWRTGLREGQRLAVAASNKRRGIAVVATPMREGRERVFRTMMDAERVGFNHAKISLCLSGDRRSHKGYFWRAR